MNHVYAIILCALCAAPLLAAREDSDAVRLEKERQSLLEKLAVESPDTEIRVQSVLKIADQDVLAQIALKKEEVLVVRQTAVHRLTDQAVLEKIALDDMDHNIRTAAVDMLTDQALLAKIALTDLRASVRAAAAKKLIK